MIFRAHPPAHQAGHQALCWVRCLNRFQLSQNPGDSTAPLRFPAWCRRVLEFLAATEVAKLLRMEFAGVPMESRQKRLGICMDFAVLFFWWNYLYIYIYIYQLYL